MISGEGFSFVISTEYSIINGWFHGDCAKVKEMNSLNE